MDDLKLIVGDKCLSVLETVGNVFTKAKYQRCYVLFYCDVFSVTPRFKVKIVAKMLEAHVYESKKAKTVVEELRSMNLKEDAQRAEDSTEKTLTDLAFSVNTGFPPYQQCDRD